MPTQFIIFYVESAIRSLALQDSTLFRVEIISCMSAVHKDATHLSTNRGINELN